MSAVLTMTKKMAKLSNLAGVLAVVLTSCGSGQREGMEVTATDFTATPSLTSTKLLTFGVGLRDTESSARETVEHAGLKWQPPVPGDPFAFAQVKDSEGQLLMEVHSRDGKIDTIRWHSGLSTHLTGKGHLLLEAAILEPGSPSRKQLLGDDGTRTAEAAAGGRVETVRYTFSEKGFELRGTKENGNWLPELTAFELTVPKY
jgi:hypothetical protein